MKKLLNISMVAVVATLPMVSFAQFQKDVYREYSKATVKHGGHSGAIELPWTGGANNPQISTADLNNDGLEDVVLFEDYIGVTTLIATGKNSYKYDSWYKGNFPPCNGYMKLIDFNRDGIKDCITRNMAGVGIFYGYYEGDELKFKYYKDLYYTNGTGPVNVYVSPGDIPGMADIDGDGDIDIISYDVWGSTIQLYQNCQVEGNLPKDSVTICLKDECWGRTLQFYERNQLLGHTCDQSGTTCKGCYGKSGNKATHSGNTLCLIDIDNDGDKDYFNGNVSFPDIQFFYNGKKQYHTADSAIAQDTIWASNGVDMYMPMFPIAYYIDVNHDNILDLLFSPFAKETENYNSLCWYENTGSNTNKNFVWRSNSYLIDRMIDMGTGSYPVFYDFDKDGRKDLFIGSDGFYQPSTNKLKSRVAYYKNATTTTEDYTFELQTDDFLGLDSLDVIGASLAIGDLDNDSLDDLVVGHKDGTFSFYKNYASSDTVAPEWKLTIQTIRDTASLKVLDVGEFATPCIYDIDGDGKNDLISGNQDGDLYYFNNYASLPGYVGLKKVTANLGKIKLSNPNDPYGYSAPYIGPMDNTGKDYLVIGCDWGQLYRYDGFQNGANPATYTMIDSQYSYINVKKRSAPAFANVDNDPKKLHELVLGNELGGLFFYKQDFNAYVNDKIVGSKNVTVYPNPVRNVLNIKWDEGFGDGSVYVRLVSVTGQTIVAQSYSVEQKRCSIQLGDIPSGVYYCIVQSGADKSVQSVSVLK